MSRRSADLPPAEHRDAVQGAIRSNEVDIAAARQREAAARRQRERAIRKALGLRVFRLELHELDVVEALLIRGLIADADSEDQEKIEDALEALVGEWTKRTIDSHA